MLLATDAASEGLNLQHRCRLVVHLEVPWTPTRIEQRVGRVDRIGQSRTVHQVLLVAGGTVEESRVATRRSQDVECRVGLERCFHPRWMNCSVRLMCSAMSRIRMLLARKRFHQA